ncbi:MAG: ParD-like family protein, partial [Hydrogenophaga sp.]|nr:ParD-like family protein [Hydrogenophaga sp.]
MTTVSVRIDESLVDAARVAAKAEFRTVQGQVEFWAKVGRAALDNPDLPASFIPESLMSLAESLEDSTPFVLRSLPADPARTLQAWAEFLQGLE